MFYFVKYRNVGNFVFWKWYLLFSRCPVIFTGSLLYRGLLRYHRCCRIISFWRFPDIACLYVLSAFVLLRYVYITLVFKLLTSLVFASFYRLRVFIFVRLIWSAALCAYLLSFIYTAFNVFYLMVMYLYYLLFKIAVRALFWRLNGMLVISTCQNKIVVILLLPDHYYL